MKKDNFWIKVNKERKRVKWTTRQDTIKYFFITILFALILMLIIFGFSAAVIAIFDAIG